MLDKNVAPSEDSYQLLIHCLAASGDAQRIMLFLDLVRDFELTLTSEHLWELVRPLLDVKQFDIVIRIFEKILKINAKNLTDESWEVKFLEQILINHDWKTEKERYYALELVRTSIKHGIKITKPTMGCLIRIQK
eukprot:UN27746